MPETRWGHLSLLSTRHVPVMHRKPDGSEYVADTHGPVTMFFQCDCGHEFSMEKRDFPGRRVLRYCGRPECPHAPKPKPVRVRSDPSSLQTIYLPQSLIDYARNWARAHGTSYSGAIRELLRKAIVDELTDSE